jgi:S-adenosylmethionine hydrolase
MTMPVTLLTDFGASDYYVAAMKGVILGRNPQTPIVDITHEVPPQDVRTAAFVLFAVYDTFPRATVHTVVVDPGVGSPRRALIVAAAGQFFVGPDNGVFSYIYDCEPAARIFDIAGERLFREVVSTTFHGRDVFAPLAATLAGGADPTQLGERITDPVRLEPLRPTRSTDGSLCGRILHVDRFGNCVTNLTREDLPSEAMARGFCVTVRGHEVRSVRRYYAEPGPPGELFAIWGSAGFLEISADRASAAERLGVRADDPVTATVSQHT